MLLLCLIIPVAAACGYAVAGWRRLTAWWAVAAALTVVAVALSIAMSRRTVTALDGVLSADPHTAALLAVAAGGMALALAGAVAQLGKDLRDHRIGKSMTRAFGTAACLGLSAVVVAITASWVAVRLAAVVAIFGLVAVLLAVRRRRDSRRAAATYAAVSGLAATSVAVGLGMGGDTGVWLCLAGWATLAGLLPWPGWLWRTHATALTPVALLAVPVGVTVAAWQWRQLPIATAPQPLALAGVVGLVAAAGVALVASDARVLPLAGAMAYLGADVLAATPQQRWSWSLAGLLAVGGLAVVTGHVVALTGTARRAKVRGMWRRHRLLASYQVAAGGAVVLSPLPALMATASGPWPAAMLGGLGYVVFVAATSVHIAGMVWGAVPGHDVVTGGPRRLGSAAGVIPLSLAVWCVAFGWAVA